MNVTAARGRRALAVLTTAGALLLPAAAATAAPAEQANERAHGNHGTDEERTEAPEHGNAGSSYRDDEVTEDDDPHDDDGADRPNTPDVNGDADNAHPSGRDRSAEAGGSGNQGRAQHDPDDDGNGPDRSNGGLDQPGGQGGEDLDDQDGNNGCGNDDDFEDDNEGWCGRPTEDEADEEDTTTPTTTGPRTTSRQWEVAGTDVEPAPAQVVVEDREVTTTAPEGALPEEAPAEVVETGVLGVTFTREPDSEVLGAVAANEPDVEAAVVAEVSSVGELPRTGAGLAGLAAIGVSALAGGTALARRRD